VPVKAEEKTDILKKRRWLDDTQPPNDVEIAGEPQKKKREMKQKTFEKAVDVSSRFFAAKSNEIDPSRRSGDTSSRCAPFELSRLPSPGSQNCKRPTEQKR